MTTAHKHDAPATKGRTIRWWAPLYDAVATLMSFGQLGGIRRDTVRVAAVSKGEAVLDVGCGSGSLTLLAAGRAGSEGRVAGIDASPEMIEVASGKAKKRRLAIDFSVAPIEALPFANGEFDVVLSSLMLHHLPDDVKVLGLKEVRRVLKPGGRLVAVDLAGGHGPLSGIMGLLGHKMPRDYAERLKSAMTSAGFANAEEVETKRKWLVFLRAS